MGQPLSSHCKQKSTSEPGTEGWASPLYWTGVGSDALSETDLSGTINEDYFYFNGQRVARVDRPSNAVHYYVNDRLGTASIVATPATHDTATFADSDYSPYGIEIPVAGSDANHYKFTGKERDSESGLDNFGARYFTAALGRFMTPDDPFMDQDPADPQSLNLYTYVRNNPLSSVDPTGLWCVWEDGTHDDPHSQGGADQGQCKDQGGHWDSSDLITGVHQKDGIITQISYTTTGDCTGSECGLGETLDAFDKGLAGGAPISG